MRAEMWAVRSYSRRVSLLQLVKLAKRLKKEKVNVDIINFGEEVRFRLHFSS